MIWFKHVYWPEPGWWGVIGVPIGQDPSTVLARYKREDRVLLALTRDAESDLRGKIFAVCTLYYLTKPTSQIINPEVPPERYKQWPKAIAIRKLWKVEPIDYESFAGGKLASEAKRQRGKFFVAKDGQEEFAAWLGSTEPQTDVLQHSPAVLDHIKSLPSENPQ